MLMLLQSGPIEVISRGPIAPRLGGEQNKNSYPSIFFGTIYRCPISLHFWLVNWRIIQFSKWFITMLNNNNGLVATPLNKPSNSSVYQPHVPVNPVGHVTIVDLLPRMKAAGQMQKTFTNAAWRIIRGHWNKRRGFWIPVAVFPLQKREGWVLYKPQKGMKIVENKGEIPRGMVSGKKRSVQKKEHKEGVCFLIFFCFR